MQIILYLLFLPILYLNYKIVISDIKEKKIPNKYLLYLLYILPIFYILVFGFNLEILQINHNITFLGFIIQLIFIFLFCFILFYIGAWSAGDAKYILVLSLYIINIGVIPFIINISILTIIYLFGYFLYFYFIKSVFNHKYRKSLLKDIYNDIKESISTVFKDPVKGYVKIDIIKKAFKLFIIYLIIFVSSRLLRIYLYYNLLYSGDNKGHGGGRIGFIINYLKDYKTSIIILGIIGFLIFYHQIRKFIRFIKKQIIGRLKKYLIEKKKINADIIDFGFLFLLTILLLSFITYEYLINPYEITKILKRIFGFAMLFVLTWRILFYAYKLTFQLKEQKFIDINTLKLGNIIDKKYLINIFGTQKVLGYKNKKGLLYPNPEKYFNKIDNPIDNETRKKLQKIYKIVNEYHKKHKTIGFSEIKTIKILKTFAFGVYIFYGFIITIFLGNTLFETLIKFIGMIIKRYSGN